MANKPLQNIQDTGAGTVVEDKDGQAVVNAGTTTETPTIEPTPTSQPEAVQATTQSSITSMLGNKSTGLENSWNKEAKQYSDKIYQQSKAEAQSEYSVKASELKTQAQQSQEEVEMQKYTNAQTTDKLGWTGGYVLDQQRQMNVLKAGIQAQLFNTQELNKLGLESSLAAARVNADLKNQELAHQYYQDAVNNALNQAQITGYYISPEASDYLVQKRAADQILATADPNSAEYAQAQSVSEYVTNYFGGENGLSDPGIKTLAYLQYELSQEQSDREAKQLEISYIMASQSSDDYKEGKAGLYVDANGKTVFAGTTDDDPYGSGPDLVNFSSITADQLKEICNMNPEGLNASFYEQCIDYKLGEIAKLYDNFLTTQGMTASENSWEEFKKNPTNKALLENFEAIKNIDIKPFDKDTILNGSAVPSTNFTLDANLNITFTKEDKQDTGTQNEIVKSIQDKLVAATNAETKANNSLALDDILTNKTFGGHVSLETEQDIRGTGIDDDFDINLSWDGKLQKNYDIDVDWEYGNAWQGFWSANNYRGVDGTSEDTWNTSQKYLQTTYGTPTKDSLVIYNNQLWYYNVSVGKWGYVQNGAGGAKLLDDLRTVAQGTIPSRWK